ncbi:MAG: queuosine precursor transporter [Bacillota bacterium]|nr:queuosine precursor transporter [Bacillota bacterium]
MLQQESRRGISVTFLLITCAFVTCLLITNIVAGRLIQFGSFTLTGDLFFFPITYIFGDVLTEVYGFKRARLTIWTGFAANLFMALVFMAIIALPYPDFWNDNAAYSTVLGFTPRVVLASLMAYFAGEFSNSILLSRMKVWTNGKWLWTRTVGSTLVGEGLDTLIFMLIAFYGIFPTSIFISMVLVQYFWKVGYEIAATPLTYWIVARLKQKESMDAFDRGINYNPFTVK